MTVFILGANIPSLPPLTGFCVIPRAYSVEMQFMCFTVRRRNQTNALLAVTCVRCTQPARRQKLTVYRMNKQVEILKSFRCSKSHCTWRKSVEFSRSVTSDSATPWTAARQASLSISNSWSLLKLSSIESVMPSNHLILCRPLLLLPSIFPSIRVFSNESALRIRWPKEIILFPLKYWRKYFYYWRK